MFNITGTKNIIRNLQIIFSISILLLVIGLLASIYNTQKQTQTAELVNHTNNVILKTESILSSMKDAETSQRGYLLTLAPEFLKNYTSFKFELQNTLSSVKILTADNVQQQINYITLKKLIDAKYLQLEKSINHQQQLPSKTYAANEQVENIKVGKSIMDEIRNQINLIKTEEQLLLQKRKIEFEKYTAYSPTLITITGVLAILIILFAYFKIKNDVKTRIDLQEQLENKLVNTAQRIGAIENVAAQIAINNFSAKSMDESDDELGRIGIALNSMRDSLEKNFTELQNRLWLEKNAVGLNDVMREEKDVLKLAENIVNYITNIIDSPLATLYIINKNNEYKLANSYGAKDLQRSVNFGEGILGQVLKSQKIEILEDIPEAYLTINSSLVIAKPLSIVATPFTYGNTSIGVLELALLKKPTEIEVLFLNQNAEAISIAINAALDYERLQELLEETQAQGEELQAQHSEMENINAELETQTQKLQASEEELRVQQEELQQTNGELEERSSLLEERNIEIQQKAQELALSTRYKSEFLANMSHELRTPLNSILLLSRLLSDNNEKNLNIDQIEYARVIQSSGNGLLNLIDEILDLSKIESGKMDIEFDNVIIEEVADDLKSLFEPLAKEKKIEFTVQVDKAVPKSLETDKVKLEQIIKNFLSNSFKFTSKGSITFTITRSPLNQKMLCFKVKDTGIGIPSDKQHLIFEAFQQADGSTKRKYGGTGLGLSISRELTKLLGGEIKLTSEPNEGSEFALYIPIVKTDVNQTLISLPTAISTTEEIKKENSTERSTEYISSFIPKSIDDDRATLTADDKCILIVEDDVPFAKSLLEYARKKGYKGIVSVRGDEALPFAKKYAPVGILLDIQLPIKSGWEAMDELKNDAQTRHIPVHIMSSHKKKKESLLKGAVDFIEKPFAFEQMKEVFEKIEQVLKRDPKKVLIIEDNNKHAQALSYFLSTYNINTDVKNNLTDSVIALKNDQLDCVILDMGMPGNIAYEVLEEAKQNANFENLPIIVFTGKSLSLTEEKRIKQYADSIIIKTAHSYQRMLDEVSLFLHLVEDQKMTTAKNNYKKSGALSDVLKNKTVLIADDDVRNVFSLSKALENIQLNVITSVDGKEALQKLKENPSIDIVLLDMMMPQMDGYETAKKIRENPKWKNLPVIAVTAKAMSGDREKCIEAGASDYITKPVDIDQLLSLLRVWLYDKKTVLS
ncbi:MAG: response regulator [Bacteroidia bacterium]